MGAAALFVLGVLLSACLPPLPPEIVAPTQTVQAVYARMRPAFLDGYGMPAGWRMNFTSSTSRLAGGVGNTVSFHPRSDMRSWNHVFQDIVYFPDLAMAEAGFRELASHTIPPEAAAQYSLPLELNFAAGADEVVRGCIPMSSNGQSFLNCRFAARYGNYITNVGANVVPVWGLSLSRLGSILKRVDDKMTALRGS